MFRQQLEEMMGNEGLALKLDAPEELVEDPTFEIRRLLYSVRYKSTKTFTFWQTNLVLIILTLLISNVKRK